VNLVLEFRTAAASEELMNLVQRANQVPLFVGEKTPVTTQL
jgi:hypothetical protein